MFNRFNFANKVFEGVSRSISVAPKLCTKIKHKNSPCSICYTVCPANAIEVGGPGETITIDWDKCLGCGICISQCPSQTYKLRHGGYKKFIENISKSINQWGELHIICGAYEGFNKNSALIECVGMVNVVDFLVLYLRGARSIYIKYGLCSECDSKYGKNTLDQEVKLLLSLKEIFEELNQLDLVYEHDCIHITFPKQYPIIKPVDEEKPNPAVNRRGMFSFLKDSLTDAIIKSADVVMADDPESRTKIDFSHELTPRRQMFIESILELGKVTKREVETGRLFNNIEVDESCIYCGMCARFCSTGALLMNEEKTRLTFNPSKCISCGLCEKACYHNKLHYKASLDIKYFFDDIVLVERKSYL